MADIFLSYASEDRERVRPLVAAFEQRGWSVFWDLSSIPAGRRFYDVIDEALRDSACIVVIWSQLSVNSDWVRAEAERGRQRDVLVPVRIDDIPIPFDGLQTANLIDSSITTENDAFNRLITHLSERLGPPGARVWRKGFSRMRTRSRPCPKSRCVQLPLY